MKVERSMKDVAAPRTVLCAVADDDHLQHVVAAGRALARTGSFRARFVHVAAPAVRVQTAAGSAAGAGSSAAPLPSSSIEELTEHARQAALDVLHDAGIDEEEAVIVVGDPVTEINRLAAEHDAALIVAGSDRRGALASAIVGNVSRKLARTGACPVLFARGNLLPGVGGPVVCGIDLDDEQAIRPAVHAAELALLMNRSLVLVHVLTDAPLVPGAAGPVLTPTVLKPTRRQRDYARRVLDAVRLLPEESIENVILEGGSVASELDRFAASRRADLLVVGSGAGRAVQRALQGSVSLELLRNGRRPLVIVPPDRRAQPHPDRG